MRKRVGWPLKLWHIAGMIEDGQAVPEASSLDALENDPNMKGAVAVLVSIEPPAEKTVRINITARESQVEAIDQLAGKAGLTRSAYMVQSSLRRFGSYVPKKRAREVSRRSALVKVGVGNHTAARFLRVKSATVRTLHEVSTVVVETSALRPP